jgi:hypothetical protein
LFLINSIAPKSQSVFKAAVLLSLIIHVGFLVLWLPSQTKTPKKIAETIVVVNLEKVDQAPEKIIVSQDSSILLSKSPATQDAPAAPSPEEWAFASKYTLKNSKGYRHTWGQQVRSMMGTAVESPDQGQVRFKIEIAPNGSIQKVETLWKTSDVAETLARKAINSMPALPPTPTGKVLIFEKTISFSPFADDAPPMYKDDCLPDPPTFHNPFAWDGQSPQVILKTESTEKLSPEALAECLKQLPVDSIEAESAHDRRQQEKWGSSKLNK